MGVIEGNITARKLETSNDAKIKGTLKGEKVIIGGRVEGTIDVDKIALSSTAKRRRRNNERVPVNG